jgi:hypothetical protein
MGIIMRMMMMMMMMMRLRMGMILILKDRLQTIDDVEHALVWTMTYPAMLSGC